MASYTQNVHKSDQTFPAKSVKSLGLLCTILHGINIYLTLIVFTKFHGRIIKFTEFTSKNVAKRGIQFELELS